MLRFIVALLLLTFVAGCQTTQGQRQSNWPQAPRPSTVPPESASSAPGAEQASPAPLPQYEPLPRAATPLPANTKTAEQVSGAAVVGLLKQARRLRDTGKSPQAQAALERALHIEPRNYFVWSALAGTYLEQANYAQALSHAQKSNSLARGNPYAELENYRVIAAAREATGDPAGALAAKARVDELQRMLAQPQ